MRVQRVDHHGMSVRVAGAMPVAQVGVVGGKVGVVMLQFRGVHCGPKPQNGKANTAGIIPERWHG